MDGCEGWVVVFATHPVRSACDGLATYLVLDLVVGRERVALKRHAARHVAQSGLDHKHGDGWWEAIEAVPGVNGTMPAVATGALGGRLLCAESSVAEDEQQEALNVEM